MTETIVGVQKPRCALVYEEAYQLSGWGQERSREVASSIVEVLKLVWGKLLIEPSLDSMGSRP